MAKLKVGRAYTTFPPRKRQSRKLSAVSDLAPEGINHGIDLLPHQRRLRSQFRQRARHRDLLVAGQERAVGDHRRLLQLALCSFLLALPCLTPRRSRAMLIPLKGRRLYYDLSGPDAGPVVCLTHSLASDSGMWAEQLPPLLAAGFRVLRLDMRGHGGSDA